MRKRAERELREARWGLGKERRSWPPGAEEFLGGHLSEPVAEGSLGNLSALDRKKTAHFFAVCPVFLGVPGSDFLTSTKRERAPVWALPKG